ncbi:MAG TPA: alpha/beta fold hydrolase [Chloroflexia bacterium]|nr:alpha/beta fold hydrolase [Chloroflexia bacterium]
MSRSWGARVARWGLLGGASVAGGLAVRASRRVAAMETLTPEAAAPGGTFATVDGLRVRYLEAGPPDAPALVLIHGFGGMAETWGAVMGRLAGEYRLIAPDLPGFGYSERSSAPIFTLRRRAEGIVALLDHLGIGRATLVGNSMGGAVALQTAYSFPERVDRLVLADAVAGYDGKGTSPSPLLGEVLRRTPLGKILLTTLFYDDARAAKLVGAMYYDRGRFTPQMQAHYLRPRRVRGSLDSLLALTATRADDNLPTGIAAIATPTLILWGQDDRLVGPAYAERLHADLRDSRVVLIPDCGHLPQEERPDAFVAALRGFLTGTASPPARVA